MDRDADEAYSGSFADAPLDADVWADDDADEVADETWADEEVAGEGAPAPKDPLVTPLIITALLLVVVILVTAASVFLFLGTLNNAPRTVAEREITVWEAAVAERPKDWGAWSNLAYAYSQAGRHDDAVAAVDKGIKYSQERLLLKTKADVLRYAGRYRQALTTYDSAEKAAKVRWKRIVNEALKVGVTEPPKDDTLALIYMGRGVTKDRLGDTKGAIADLELAVEEQPRQASIRVLLGDVYAKSGDTEKAEEQYREALKYIPDYPDALEGLKRIEEGGK
jgi:tetratricopeptide (TPR) repeat protein